VVNFLPFIRQFVPATDRALTVVYDTVRNQYSGFKVSRVSHNALFLGVKWLVGTSGGACFITKTASTPQKDHVSENEPVRQTVAEVIEGIVEVVDQIETRRTVAEVLEGIVDVVDELERVVLGDELQSAINGGASRLPSEAIDGIINPIHGRETQLVVETDRGQSLAKFFLASPGKNPTVVPNQYPNNINNVSRYQFTSSSLSQKGHHFLK